MHGTLWLCHVVNKLVKSCLLNIAHCLWQTSGHRQLCYSLSDVSCWNAWKSILVKMSSVIASLFSLLEFRYVLSECWQRPLWHCPLLHLTQGVLHSCHLRPRMAWLLDFTFSFPVLKQLWLTGLLQSFCVVTRTVSIFCHFFALAMIMLLPQKCICFKGNNTDWENSLCFIYIYQHSLYICVFITRKY